LFQWQRGSAASEPEESSAAGAMLPGQG
jgi:hypothetical protein